MRDFPFIGDSLYKGSLTFLAEAAAMSSILRIIRTVSVAILMALVADYQVLAVSNR